MRAGTNDVNIRLAYAQFMRAGAFSPEQWPKALEDYILDNPLLLGDRWDIVKMSWDEFKVQAVESVMYLHAKTYYVGEAVVSVVGRDQQGKSFRREYQVDNKLIGKLIALLKKLAGRLAQTKTAFVETFLWNDGDRKAPWTPWGPAQRAREIIPGVRIYSTAGHGGMAVDTSVARKMLSATARSWAPAEKGFHWFEEDQVIAIPFYERPEWLKAIKPGVSPDHYEQKIRRTMPDYFEDLEKSSATGRTAKHPLDGVRRHQLLPKNVARTLPPIYSQEQVEDPIVHVKLFSPYSKAVWYLTEYDPSDGQAFGWADLGTGGGELGYIHIPELEAANKGGLPLVERELYWRPMPLSKAKVSR